MRWTPHSCAYGQRHAAAALWRCRFVPSATLSTTAGHRSDVTHDDNGDNDDGVVDLLSGDLGETFQAVDLLSGAVGSGLTPSSSDTVGEEGVSLSPQTEGPFDDVVVSEAAAKVLVVLMVCVCTSVVAWAWVWAWAWVMLSTRRDASSLWQLVLRSA